MADILDPDNGVTTSPVNIDDLVTTTPLESSQAPLPAARNRAATTAMISNPFDAVDNYNTMMTEAQQGSSDTYNVLNDNIASANKQQDLQSVMGILSDPNQSLETKQGVVKSFNDNLFLKDKAVSLQTNLLAQPSTGETPDSEAARISTADTVGEIYNARTQIQGLVNNHIASLPSRGVLGATADFLGAMVPLSNSITTSKVAGAISDSTGIDRSWLQKLGTFLQPGSTMQDIRDHLASLPPAQRVEFAKTVKDSVAGHSGLIFGNDNQYEQFEKLDSIFQDGGYGSFNEFWDNVSPLLDAVGIGQAGRGVARLAKGAGEVGEAAGAAARVEPSMGFTGASQDAANAERATAGRGPAADVSDVDFTESTNGNFQPVEPKVGPAGQLTNPVPKLTAPVDRISEPAPVPKLLKGPVQDVEDIQKRIEINSPARLVNPATPGEIAQNSNPQVARNIADMIYKQTDDEMAQAMMGVDRDQAITNMTIPQATTEAGAVDSRANDIWQGLREDNQIDPKLVDIVNDTSVDAMTPTEKAAARANVTNEFRNASGLTINEPMSSFQVSGNRAIVSGVYDVPAGSFSNAQAAMDQAKFSLRHFGVDDSDIQVLRKEGNSHVPVDDISQLPEGNYKIRVNVSHELNPSDLNEMSKLDVKRNFFDRFPSTVSSRKGSLSRTIFDASSMLHPNITGAASVAKDYTARLDKFLLEKAAEYGDVYKKLPIGRQAAIDDYVKEANFNGIAFDQADLIARGFSPNEIGVVRSWRQFWDNHYYLENLDLVRSMRANGYQYFKNANAELFAKPLAKDSTLGRFYDPASDSVRNFAAGELDDLYNKGGTLAKLRRPASFNGTSTEYMIARNTANEYLQGISDSTKVLNYRKGYYQLTYKAPKFVDEIDPITQRRARTIAVAGDVQEAQSFADRMKGNTGLDYRVRSDDRMLMRDSDEAWDLNSASGRVAQRHRGKLLEDGSGLNHLGDGSYIVNPVEAAIRSAKSIAGRTVMRPMLETASQRFMKQYERYLPSNGMGGVRFPKTVGEIGAIGEHTTSGVADARTTWEYLNYLKNGYVNSMDDTFKALFNTFADAAGSKGLTTAEKGLRTVGNAAPMSGAKGVVFNAYIAMNPLRQVILQSSQLYRTMVYNPIGWLTGSIPKKFMEYGLYRMGGAKTEFADFLDRSGLVDAVDRHNLVSSSLMNLADESNKLKKGVGTAMNIARSIGFDVGESSNIIGHAATVFDRYKRLGIDLTTKTGQEKAYSEIRALSFDMNAAGDMPYNQTNLSAVMQFMQMPHKSILQLTNRRLDVSDRVRLGLGDMLLWGTGIGSIATLFGKDMMPDDPRARELLKTGVVATMFNHMLNTLWDGSHDANFSSLDPRGLDGWMKFGTSIMSDGLWGAIMNSPAATLLFKQGGRMQTAIQDIGRYFNVIPEFDDNDPTKFTTVLNDVAKISSGWNNGAKAYLMLNMQQRRDQYGQLIDDKTTTGDSIAQLFGFGAESQQDTYELSQQWAKDIKNHKEDSLQVYKDIKQYYANKLSDDPEFDTRFITGVSGAAMHVFENDPEALREIQKQMQYDFMGPDQGLMQQFLRRAGLPDETNMMDQIQSGPWSDSDKEKMKQAYQIARDAQANLVQYNKDKH